MKDLTDRTVYILYIMQSAINDILCNVLVSTANLKGYSKFIADSTGELTSMAF